MFTCLVVMQAFCFRAAFQSTFSALNYTSAVERLPPEDSVRVTTPQTDQEIVFTAQHQNHSWLCVCVCMCEIEQGRLEADTL